MASKRLPWKFPLFTPSKKASPPRHFLAPKKSHKQKANCSSFWDTNSNSPTHHQWLFVLSFSWLMILHLCICSGELEARQWGIRKRSRVSSVFGSFPLITILPLQFQASTYPTVAFKVKFTSLSYFVMVCLVYPLS